MKLHYLKELKHKEPLPFMNTIDCIKSNGKVALSWAYLLLSIY